MFKVGDLQVAVVDKSLSILSDATPHAVVGIGYTVIGGKAVEAVVGVGPVERIRAYGMAPRHDAPHGVVLVLKAAKRRARCRFP